MKKEKQKLSLDAFKQKARVREDNVNLDKIAGGILGSCHCVTVMGEGTWIVVHCYYTVN